MTIPANDDFLLLILSSPSGAGKSTLCSRLRGEFADLRFSVSHTTRPPRPTEVNGREYNFVTPEAFQQMLAREEFAEWARVHDHHYGTSLAEIDIGRRDARGVIFDIDFQGARQIKAHHPEAVGVFVLPPSWPELERRLRGRATETEQAVARRLSNAREEVGHYGFFDYVIVNDDIHRAYEQLRAVVLAERARRFRHAKRCESLLNDLRQQGDK